MFGNETETTEAPICSHTSAVAVHALRTSSESSVTKYSAGIPTRQPANGKQGLDLRKPLAPLAPLSAAAFVAALVSSKEEEEEEEDEEFSREYYY